MYSDIICSTSWSIPLHLASSSKGFLILAEGINIPQHVEQIWFKLKGGSASKTQIILQLCKNRRIVSEFATHKNSLLSSASIMKHPTAFCIKRC